MRILEHVAQRIIDEVTKVIDEEVIVINRDGYIIAASDSTRIGAFHEGGKEVVRTKKKLIISKKEVERLQGVKIGLNLPIRFQQQVIGVIGITGSKQETTRYGELIQRLTELIIEEAYAQEILDSEMRGLEAFVSEWLHSDRMSDDLFDRGEILGMNMSISRYCVIVQLEDDAVERNIEHDIYRYMQSIFTSDCDHVVVRWGKGRFVLLYASKKSENEMLYLDLQSFMERVEKMYEVKMKISSSRIHKPEAMHIAYKEAKQAIAMKHVEEKIIFYDSFILELALNEIDQATKKRIVTKVIGELRHHKELLFTLQTYFESNLSIKETAETLHIHINTLHYRLKKIHQLTGFNVKETKDLVTLYIAYSFLKPFLDESTI